MHLIDFHAHILPGADHGSKSLEESVAQISLMRENGIRDVVATPHFYGHTENLSSFLSRVNGAYEILSQEMVNQGWDSPKIHIGAEVLLFIGLENLEGLGSLAIRGTKTLLLELPYGDLSQDHAKTVHRIIRKGYDVVLAHADRYQAKFIDLLIEMGAKIQLNADAFHSFFMKKPIKKWLAEGAVVALGSDIHGADARAYKLFLNAEQKIEKYFESIQQSSEKLIRFEE